MSETSPKVGERTTNLAESPLFWFGLFAAMALLGLVAVAPRYGQRQAGLEQRHEARQRAAARGDQPPGEAEGIDFEERQLRARSSLMPLMLLALIALVIIVVATIALRRRRPLPLDNNASRE